MTDHVDELEVYRDISYCIDARQFSNQKGKIKCTSARDLRVKMIGFDNKNSFGPTIGRVIGKCHMIGRTRMNP